MKKIIKIIGIVSIILVFILSLYCVTVALLSYYHIITNFLIFSIILKLLLFSTEFGLISCLSLYMIYFLHMEYKYKIKNPKI